MKGRFWRKALAAALALLIVSGSTPIQPFSQVFDRTVIKASAATQTVTKTVKFDMDGGQSGTTTKLDNYNIYSSSAGTLNWSCNQPNINYIHYSYDPENGDPGRTRLRGNLLQYEGTAEFCDIVGKVTKVEISNFRIGNSGVEMCVGKDRTNTSTLLHLEGTTNDFDYSSTDSGYGSVVFEGEVDVDKNNPLKIMLYPKEISNETTAEFDFRGGSITITYEVEEEVTGDPGHTFSFNATGNTLTATCNQTDADHACGLTNGTATLTLTANDMAFDGSLLRRTATLNTQDFSKATGITDIVTTFIYEDKNTHETSPTGVIFPGNYTVTATIIINGDTAHPYTLTKDFSVVDGHKINNVYSQFSLSKSAALKGEEVTITYSQKMDESFEELKLIGATSGNSIPYTTNADGTYTFTMPDEDVNLNATITYPINENDITQNGDTFTIKTADGWDYFCQRMKVDGELNGFSGKTVELGDDITVNTMAGNTDYPFKGTFDGKGHTLTFNTTALMANTAPFHLTDGATIRNLHATGQIEGGAEHYLSGLVGSASGNLTIENCRVSTQISTTYNSNYDVGIGGIVGYIHYTNYLDECHITGTVFDGLIYNPNSAGRTYGCGGFVGAMEQYASVDLTDCLFIEGQYDNNGKCELDWGTNNDKNSTFFHRSNNTGEGTLTNCFFVATHFLKQGSPAVASATKPANLGAETDHCFMKSYGHVLFFDGKYYTPKYGDLIEQYGYSGEKTYTIECNDGTSLGIPDFTSQLSTTYLRYNRKFTVGKAEIVMLPFNFTKNDFRRGDFDNNLNGKFYSFAGTDGSVTVMDDANEVTSMIANTPYIYVPGENSEYWYIARYGSDITIFTEGNDGGNKTVTDEDGLWTLTGTYEPKSFTTDDSNIMVLNDVGELVAVTDALNDPAGEQVLATDATKVRSTSGYFVRDGIKITQGKLSLNGDIGVTVGITIPTEYTGEGYYMYITSPRQAAKKCDDIASAYDKVNGMYLFSYNVAAKEMTDDIDFTLKNASGETVYTESVSVRKIALSYLADSENYGKEIPVIKAMLNYGAYAQEYFGYRTDDPANAGYKDDTIDTITADTLKSYAYNAGEASHLPEGVAFKSVYLSMETEMRLNMVVENTTGKELTFSVPNGYSVKTSGSGERVTVSVTGIKAENIGDKIKVTVSCDETSGYQWYSPLTYAYNRIRDKDREAGISKAMFRYYTEAEKYAATKSE